MNWSQKLAVSQSEQGGPSSQAEASLSYQPPAGADREGFYGYKGLAALLLPFLWVFFQEVSRAQNIL